MSTITVLYSSYLSGLALRIHRSIITIRYIFTYATTSIFESVTVSGGGARGVLA